MIQEFKFDKNRDRGVVLEGLAPDLNAMIESGIVPDTGAEIVYNQLEDIKEVGCRVSDVFEAMVLQKNMISRVSEESSRETESE